MFAPIFKQVQDSNIFSFQYTLLMYICCKAFSAPVFLLICNQVALIFLLCCDTITEY